MTGRVKIKEWDEERETVLELRSYKPMLEGRFIDGVDNTNLRLTFRFV